MVKRATNKKGAKTSKTSTKTDSTNNLNNSTTRRGANKTGSKNQSNKNNNLPFTTKNGSAKKPPKVSSSAKSSSKNKDTKSNSYYSNKINWDINKMEKDQFLSETCYYKVERILNNSEVEVDVVDHKGMKIRTNIEVLKEYFSADHYSREVPMTMTGLADILENCRDNVFTCCFHKQQTVDRAKEMIENINFADLKDKSKVANLARDLISGDLCTMTCHLVKMENILGRSSVIDLNAPLGNQFRQIDHRSIEWIIFRNVKYYLKKPSEKSGELVEYKSGDPLWDSNKISVGNWFSSTSYFKIISWDDLEADLQDFKGQDYLVSNDILYSSMYNSAVYEKEEKVTLTEIGKIFKEANSKVFTVCFNAKVDINDLKERLSKISKKELEDSKTLAKDLITGSEKTIVGRLANSEAKLGRSLVLTLPDNTFANVDHRTIKWLILKNVKYSIK